MEFIDFKFLNEITGSNKEMIHSFIEDFFDETRKFLSEMSNATESAVKDKNRIKEIAHSYKSSAKVIGAHALQQELDMLEKHADSLESGELKNSSDKILSLIHTVNKDLENYIKKG